MSAEYEMKPDELEISAEMQDETSASLQEKIDRAVPANHLALIVLTGPDCRIVLFQRVGEVDVKMMLSVEQAAALRDEIDSSIADIVVYRATGMRPDGE